MKEGVKERRKGGEKRENERRGKDGGREGGCKSTEVKMPIENRE